MWAPPSRSLKLSTKSFRENLCRRVARRARGRGCRRGDEAAREGRTELYMATRDVLQSDWSCPILYARAADLELGVKASGWESALDLYRLQMVPRAAIAVIDPDQA